MNHNEQRPPWMDIVLDVTQASSVQHWQQVQSLWSGYGQIVRCSLAGASFKTVIVKHVQFPTNQNHPRGWSTSRSHERKAHSYRVESNWYQNYAPLCTEEARVPSCLGLQHSNDQVFMVLEDLDAVGFPHRTYSVTDAQLNACLAWLAHFHATFLHVEPTGLWEIGTYWHLATRPDELAVLRDSNPILARAASRLDERLNSSPYRTLVHGDAKVANFCFSTNGDSVAAVDFQYVGGGCGMKDVAYFFSSCLDEDVCERRQDELLGLYFGFLKSALDKRGTAVDYEALEADWRRLYPIAWTDFFRFLEGWSPGHWKSNRYSRRLAQQVLDQL